MAVASNMIDATDIYCNWFVSGKQAKGIYQVESSFDQDHVLPLNTNEPFDSGSDLWRSSFSSNEWKISDAAVNIIQKATSKIMKQHYECVERGTTFTTKKSLTRHLRSKHFDRGQEPLRCDLCKFTSRREDILRRHRSELHQRNEPVECMRCGKKVTDRSLASHLRSNYCIGYRNDAQENARTSSKDASAMLDTIFQQQEEDDRLFQALSAERICNALFTSTCFMHRTLEIAHTLRGHEDFKFSSLGTRSDVLHLRGLTIRTMVRELTTGPMGDDLDGAIRTFTLVEHLLSPDATKVHDDAVKWLNTQRHHRVRHVVYSLGRALAHWQPVAYGEIDEVLRIWLDSCADLHGEIGYSEATPSTADSLIALVATGQRKARTSNNSPLLVDQSVHSAQRKPFVFANGSILAQTHSNSMSGASSDHEIDDGAKESKTSQQSKPVLQHRPIKRTLCPIPRCGRTMLQRVLARHLASHHGQGQIYECAVVGCEKVFLRKDA